MRGLLPPATDQVPAFNHSRSVVLGTPFDSLDQEGVVAHIVGAAAVGRGGMVVTPNVDILRLMASDPEYRALVHQAALILVDGAPVQWAARVAGQASVHRTPGSTLMLPLAAAAERHHLPLLLLGGRDGAAELASVVLQALHPDLQVQWHCPPLGFEHDPHQWQEVERAVERCGGGIVMCGLGAPKQEWVARRLLATNPHTWFLGVGGTIDFTAGMVPRAPEWVQQAGVEWLYRLLVEPRRLFRRYVVDDLPFAARMLTKAIRTRMSGNRQAVRAKETIWRYELTALAQDRISDRRAA